MGCVSRTWSRAMVEAVLHEPGFEIDETLLEEIRTSVTHILLNGEYVPSLPPRRL